MKRLRFIDSQILPREIGSEIPLTASQHSWWTYLASKGDRCGMRICAASVRILGPLNVNFLERSIEFVVRRHESLRTRIVLSGGMPRQCVDAYCDNHIAVVDLANSIDTKKEALQRAEEFIEQKKELAVGPLFEAKLLRLSDNEYVLILALEHLFSDAVSYRILSREIWASYSQATQGVSIQLPELPIQFGDYAVWQHRTYTSWYKKHEKYWRERLAGAPRSRLPLSEGLMEMERPMGATLHFPFGKAVTDALRAVVQREDMPLSLAFFAVYVAALSSWCKQKDLLVAIMSHGRHGRPELANMIGLIRDHLHLRVALNTDDSFLDLLHKINSELTSAFEHQDFDRVPEFIPECKTEMFFNWLPGNGMHLPIDHQLNVEGGLRMQQFPLRIAWPLRFLPFFFVTAAGASVTVVYRPDCFLRSAIERFGQNLRLFATQFARDPFSRVESVSVIA